MRNSSFLKLSTMDLGCTILILLGLFSIGFGVHLQRNTIISETKRRRRNNNKQTNKNKQQRKTKRKKKNKPKTSSARFAARCDVTPSEPLRPARDAPRQSRQGLSRELVEPYLLQLCGAQDPSLVFACFCFACFVCVCVFFFFPVFVSPEQSTRQELSPPFVFPEASPFFVFEEAKRQELVLGWKNRRVPFCCSKTNRSARSWISGSQIEAREWDFWKFCLAWR